LNDGDVVLPGFENDGDVVHPENISRDLFTP